MANNIINGSDLMLFVKEGTAYKSIACATNHTLTLNTEMVETSTKTKDNIVAAKTRAAGDTTWSITTDNLYTVDNTYTFYSNLGKEVDIVFGDIDRGDGTDSYFPFTVRGTTGATYTYFVGKALVSDVTINAQDGENASLSVTLQGSGNLTMTHGTK